MSDASRLACTSFSLKPNGLAYSHFKPNQIALTAVSGTLHEAALDSAYAAVISYAEAFSSLQQGSVSWPIVKLYYSCFYSLRALLLLNQVVPFNSKGEMLLDIYGGKFEKGGRSSHHWNWKAINKVSTIKGSWFTSADSEEAYEKLRKHRENVNYTHSFPDPNSHGCLVTKEEDLGKRFRSYRDDSAFFYTYLDDHLAIAYPTQLICYLDSSLKNASITLDDEKIDHVKKIWAFKDRCPIC